MISLCVFVKNESHSIINMYTSVSAVISEFILVDTGSTDNTIEVVSPYATKIYKINGVASFGEVRTLTAHYATKPWVLMLDADETLSNPSCLINLANQNINNAFAFPRKRWLDLAMTKQTELNAYPDWQVRFFRNNKNYQWKRELHEYFDGDSITHIHESSNTPIINHFHDVFKTKEDLIKRNELYTALAQKAKVSVEGGKPL